MGRIDFTRAKRAAMRSALTRHGYTERSRGLFVREADDWVAIEVQASRMGGLFYINVAWTLPALPSFRTGRALNVTDLDTLDFALGTRVEEIVPVGTLPPSWGYQDTPSLRAQLAAAVPAAGEACEALSRHLADPLKLVESIPPRLLAEDLAGRERLSGQPPGMRPAAMSSVRSALHGIYPDAFNLAWLLYHLSERAGMRSTAQDYLDTAARAAWHRWEKDLVKRRGGTVSSRSDP